MSKVLTGLVRTTGYRTLNTANGMNLTPAQCSYLDSANFAWNTASTQWLMYVLVLSVRRSLGSLSSMEEGERSEKELCTDRVC